uniref:Uncharacterized protein n=1 Tax=Chenopodium quinoa TaxID=63459 RepID=A0A803KU91_CHEQI
MPSTMAATSTNPSFSPFPTLSSKPLNPNPPILQLSTTSATKTTISVIKSLKIFRIANGHSTMGLANRSSPNGTTMVYGVGNVDDMFGIKKTICPKARVIHMMTNYDKNNDVLLKVMQPMLEGNGSSLFNVVVVGAATVNASYDNAGTGNEGSLVISSMESEQKRQGGSGLQIMIQAYDSTEPENTLSTIRGYNDYTPLDLAALAGHGKMVQYLWPLTRRILTDDQLLTLLINTINTELYAIARDRNQETLLSVLAGKCMESARSQPYNWRRCFNICQ